MDWNEIVQIFTDILNFKLLNTGKTLLTVRSIIFIIILIVVTRLILKIIQKFFSRQKGKRALTLNQNYTLQKISRYFIIVTAVFIGLEYIGLNLTFLLAGSAALFVGIGLGLQDVFKDVIAGFILLFGNAIKVGDVIEVEGIVGRVTDIDFRVSKIVTRDDIDMLIPNTKLTSDMVINWSYNNELTRFSLPIGVAYGSNTNTVKRILLAVAQMHPEVSKKKEPFVRFDDFGSSSLDFQLFFWSENTFRIENILSDLRFSIDHKFREENISIPFPQRDVHIIPKSI